MNRWKDTLGIIASATCAVHCAATPLLLAFLPALKFTEWMASPQFHQIAAVICVALVSIAIWPTFVRHRDYSVLGLSTAGLGFVLAAAFILPDECCSRSLVASTTQGLTPVSNNSHAGHSHSVADHAGHSHVGHIHASNTDSQADTDDIAFAASNLVSQSLRTIQPWLTPIGGLLLVLSHTLNLRRRLTKCGKNCQCQHGPQEADDSVSRQMIVLNSPKAA